MPPFMSAAPSPWSVSASRCGVALPLAGTVSRWPARTIRWSRPRLVCADHVVPEPLDGELGRPVAEPALDHVGELRLVVTHRRDRAQLFGEIEQIDPAHRAITAVTC